MICQNCGTEINTSTCYNCGYDNSNNDDCQLKNNFPNTNNNYRNINDGMFGNETLSEKSGVSATVEASSWFKLALLGWLISIIPFVGAIGIIIYYIVLLCKDSTAPSIKGYIKFRLILSIVITCIAVVLLILFLIVGKRTLIPTTSSQVTSLFGATM